MGKDTDLRREAEGPSVAFAVDWRGRINATLDCYREKQGGGFETIVIRFRDLSLEEVSCIGNSARDAIERSRDAQWDRAQHAVGRVKGDE